MHDGDERAHPHRLRRVRPRWGRLRGAGGARPWWRRGERDPGHPAPAAAAAQDFKSIVRLLYGRPRPADEEGGEGGHSVGRNVSLAVQAIMRQCAHKPGGLLTFQDFLWINKKYPSLLYPVVDRARRAGRRPAPGSGAPDARRAVQVTLMKKTFGKAWWEQRKDLAGRERRLPKWMQVRRSAALLRQREQRTAAVLTAPPRCSDAQPPAPAHSRAARQTVPRRHHRQGGCAAAHGGGAHLRRAAAQIGPGAAGDYVSAAVPGASRPFARAHRMLVQRLAGTAA